MIVVASFAGTWLAFLVVLAVARPEAGLIGEAFRLIPDTAVLARRLAADQTVHGVRLRLWLLLAYLASPVDLVPDFIPVLGYADDVVMIALVLRSVARRAGLDTVRRHWPGTPEGFSALARLCRLDLPLSTAVDRRAEDPEAHTEESGSTGAPSGVSSP